MQTHMQAVYVTLLLLYTWDTEYIQLTGADEACVSTIYNCVQQQQQQQLAAAKAILMQHGMSYAKTSQLSRQAGTMIHD